jgi:acetyl-CoA C-acetyltransferase
MKNDIVIVSAVRTPFSKFGGSLKKIHSSDLGVVVIKEALKRAGLKGSDIDEFYYGMCIQSEAALLYNVIARQALLKAGLPADVVSLTIDRACCSSLIAVQLGCKSMMAGDANICMVGGAENMSNTPVVLNGHRWGTGLKPMTMVDHLNPIMYVGFNSLALDAGNVALEHGIGRLIQDEWALRSQQNYQTAAKSNKFNDELTPVMVPQDKGEPVVFDKDDFPKPNTTIEGLSKLPTIYGSKTCTAGNSPGLDAGASMVIIMTRQKAEDMGVKPLATILATASVAREPERMAEVPAFAIQKALAKTKFSVDDMDVIEINEAFAAVPLVSTHILSGGNENKWKTIKDKTNINGGAIAIGHPVGASGARILMTAMYELRRRGGGMAACGICGGLAQGDAAIIKVEKL